MSNNNCVVKEYFDLNGHYLKLTLFNGIIHIVSYNTKFLNGIKYETKITSEEINKKIKIQNFSYLNLFDLISKKIEEKKYIINTDQLSVSIIFLETSKILDETKDVKIVIPKNKAHITTDYERILSREIFQLRLENKRLINEIIQIKKLLKISGGVPSDNINRYSLINKDSNQINNISTVLKSSNQIQSNQSNKNNIMENNSLKHTQNNQIIQPKGDNNNILLINQDLNICELSKLNYSNYPEVELSLNSFSKIIAYGANSYQGISRDHNEDRLKIILDYKSNGNFSLNGKTPNKNISYFAIYDGHGGNKCCNFVQEKLHNYIFESEYFPSDPLKAINQAYEKTELAFESLALDKENKKLIDKSGSCVLSALIIDEWCYLSYLGDSRALYSYGGGSQLFQASRDHKPEDIKERVRIEKAGGRIYKDTRLKVNGIKVKVNEKQAPGFKFPFRVIPGNLSVRLYIFYFIY